MWPGSISSTPTTHPPIAAATATRPIPVIVVTTVDDERKGLSLGADAYAVKPVQRRWLLDQLRRVTGRPAIRRILIVDDDEVSRYLMRRLLDDLPCVISEAETGADGLRRVREDPPDAILLDLVIPDMSGEAVLERLRADAATAGIPVIVVTSKRLDPVERAELQKHTLAIVDKATEREVAGEQIRGALTAAAVFAEA